MHQWFVVEIYIKKCHNLEFNFMHFNDFSYDVMSGSFVDYYFEHVTNFLGSFYFLNWMKIFYINIYTDKMITVFINL